MRASKTIPITVNPDLLYGIAAILEKTAMLRDGTQRVGDYEFTQSFRDELVNIAAQLRLAAKA